MHFQYVYIVLSFLQLIPAHVSSSASKYLYGCGYGSTVTNQSMYQHFEDLTVAMGATATGGSCSWADIQETSSSPYNFSICDASILPAKQRGFQLFAYSGTTPWWALNTSTVQKYGKDCGYRFPPEAQYSSQFAAAYTAIAARYNGVVKYWEFGNEENGCGWINDGCANSDGYVTYTPWLVLWYNAMKNGSDHNAVLSIGGLDYNDMNGYFNASLYIVGVIENGGANSFDAVALHPYSLQEINWQAINDTMGVLQAYNMSEKKIWINEYGWNINDESAKSAYLKNTLQRLKTCGVYQESVFQAAYLQIQDLANSSWGLVEANWRSGQITPRESWYAFQEMDKT